MRYIRIQKVVNRMCDEDVKDISSIKGIFQFILEKQLYCSVVIEADDYKLFVYDKIRIVKIDEDGCKFRYFANKATLTDYFKYKNIKELKLETEIEKVYNNGDNSDSRWYLLDIDEEKVK